MQFAYLLTRIFAIISVILVIDWANQGGESGLGGLFKISMEDPDSNNYNKVFNWHPVMMITGMIFCFVEAALSYRTWNHLGTVCNMKVAKVIHLLWQTAAVILISIGLVAVFYSHNYPVNGAYKANLYSLHSWIGIAIVTMYFAQYVMGVYNFLTPERVSSVSQREKYKPYHIYFGLFILFGAGMAIESGIQDKLLLLSNAGISCSGTTPTDTADTNPAQYYDDIPPVCQKGNWLGISIFVTLLFAGLSLFESDSKSKKDTQPGSINSGLLEDEIGNRA